MQVRVSRQHGGRSITPPPRDGAGQGQARWVEGGAARGSQGRNGQVGLSGHPTQATSQLGGGPKAAGPPHPQVSSTGVKKDLAEPVPIPGACRLEAAQPQLAPVPRSLSHPPEEAGSMPPRLRPAAAPGTQGLGSAALPLGSGGEGGFSVYGGVRVPDPPLGGSTQLAYHGGGQ